MNNMHWLPQPYSCYTKQGQKKKGSLKLHRTQKGVKRIMMLISIDLMNASVDKKVFSFAFSILSYFEKMKRDL
jgi:hypothetical protein